MPGSGVRRQARRLLADYGIVLVLVLLSAFFSVVTFGEQQVEGAAGGVQLAREISARTATGAGVMVAVRDTAVDREFARALAKALTSGGHAVLAEVRGQPVDARRELARLHESGAGLTVIACTQATRTWAVFDDLSARYPRFRSVSVVAPSPGRGSNFLKPENLLNITNQIAVIAIIAIGMTLVIITGGIDLSVGSLIALSAVVATLGIREWAGAEQAAGPAMLLCCLLALLLCAAVGWFNGLMITAFNIPPFIATLAIAYVYAWRKGVFKWR